MSSKKWLLRYGILSSVFILSSVLFNYTIDSYRIFHNDYSKLFREPNQNFIKMNFLITQKHSFDSFIFGSSRVGHINPLGIKNGNYYNMTYSEGLPCEHLSNIKLLIKKKIKIKNIVIGLDDFSYKINPEVHKHSPMHLPHYQTDINPSSKLSFYTYYLFRKPSTFDMSRVAKQTLFNTKYPTFNYDIYNTGLPLVPLKKKNYIENHIEEHINDKKFLIPSHYVGNRIEETIKSIKEIVKLSKKYNFNLVFFINPIHKTTYLDTNFNDFQNFKKRLAQVSDYYDFSGLNKITTNNYYFYETSHYRDITGELIKNRLFTSSYRDDFGVYVSKENIDTHIENLKKSYQTFLKNTL